MIGLQWMPRAAKVAYASAIDSGLTSTEPRVKDGLVLVVVDDGRGRRCRRLTPSFLAILVTRHMPVVELELDEVGVHRHRGALVHVHRRRWCRWSS